MNTYKYTYQIIKTDEAARVMEVAYSAEGKPTMHIGARLPYAGELLEAVIEMFSPVAYWREQEATVVVPPLGTGTITSPALQLMTLERAKAEKLAEIAAWRYGREQTSILLGSNFIRTDRESRAQLSSTYANLQSGLITSVNWKTADGQWRNFALAQFEYIYAAVAQHVQSCFDAEMALTERVAEAHTVEAVNAVVLA